MIYIGVLTALFLVSLSTARLPPLRAKAYFPTLAILFLFSAFRYEVGCDWISYFFEYKVAESLDWSAIPALRQPIWWAILRGMHELGLPYLVANAVSSAVFFVGIHILARRQPDPLGFLVLLFPILIINMPMSGIRQGAAIGLICIAFTAFIDRRPLKFGLWVILAAGFHTSALIFLLLLPLAAGRYSRNRLIIGAILALPGAYYLTFSDFGLTAISAYVGTDIESAGASFRVGMLTLSALYFILALRKKWMKAWPQDYPLASIGAIAMIVATFLIPVSSVIADRFAYYLVPIQILIFARIPFLPFQNGKRIHLALPYVGLFMVFVVWSQVSMHFQECYTPYQSWIFGIPSHDLLGFSRP